MRNMWDYANTLNYEQLEVFAKSICVKITKGSNKAEILELVKTKLKDRFIELCNVNSDGKVEAKILGKKGKEGIAKVVWDQRDKVHRVKKQFRKAKSANTLTREGQLQTLASSHGISPKVYEINVDDKYIVMEMMEKKTLIDIILKNKEAGRQLLSNKEQMELIDLFKRLDSIGLFHGDPNPYNFLKFPNDYHDKKVAGKFGIIDYGFGKMSENARELKLYNGKPNESLMLVGLLVILKKKGYTPSDFSVLFKNINTAVRVQFDLK